MCKMDTMEKKNLQLVKVYVRLRPFTQNEIELRRPSTVHEMTGKEVCVRSGSVEKKYNFDGVFGMNSLQSDVYEVVVYPMINFVLSGYTCTVFAYGQTGTGKTYTMIGQNIAPNIDFSTDPSVGIIPRAALHLFSQLEKLNVEYTVRVSFVEIYNEEVRDLLIGDSASLRVYDDPDNKGATCIKGITEMAVANTDELYELLNVGAAERQTAATNLNRHSSRSHTIFTIIVNIREHSDGEEITKTGKLHLIDLAGSENIGRSGATEMRAREAGTINKSLLTLGKVIKALALKMQHIPYRESKLTRILQDSLGGKSKTCMIATFSPCIEAFDETLSTLDYAHVARSVANCPTVNINRQQTNIFKTSQDEVEKLRLELHAARAGEGFYMHSASYEKMNTDIKVKNERISHLLQDILRLEDHMKMKQQHYDELNRAFEGTNKNVQLLEDELEKQNTKQKQNEHAMQKVNEKIAHLNDVTNTLTDVCEVSTKHEDIFHRKYDRQCNSTVHNASVAKNMYSTAVSCLNDAKKLAENFAKDQNIHLSGGIRRTKLIGDNQCQKQEQLNELMSQIQCTSENCNLTFDSIFRDKTYSTNTLFSQFDSFFSNCYQLQQQALQEDLASVETVRNYVFDKSADIEAHAAQCSASIDQAFLEEEEHATSTDKLLQSVYEGLDERYSRITEQIIHRRKYQELSGDSLKVLTAKYEETEKELEHFHCMQSTIDQFLLMTTENRLKPLLDIKETLDNFSGCLKPMSDLVSLVEHSVESIENNTATCQAAIHSYEDNTKTFISDFMKVFEDDMNFYNKEIKKKFSKWADQLDGIVESLHCITEEHCKHISDHLDQISQIEENHNKGVEHFVEESTQKIKNLEKNILFKIHEGDTPVKPVYNYPKVIDCEISEDLSKQMRPDAV